MHQHVAKRRRIFYRKINVTKRGSFTHICQSIDCLIGKQEAKYIACTKFQYF